jgi:hypothetical protein
MKVYTKEEIRELLADIGTETVNRWLARGDGIAVYENQALDSASAGDKKFVSYGSEVAQLFTGVVVVGGAGLPDQERWADPPTRLPDIGGQINWRYQLIGVYFGEAL